MNNPVKYIDPTGHTPECPDCDEQYDTSQEYLDAIRKMGIEISASAGWRRQELVALFYAIRNFPHRGELKLGSASAAVTKIIRLNQESQATAAWDSADGTITVYREQAYSSQLKNELGGIGSIALREIDVTHELVHAWQSTFELNQTAYDRASRGCETRGTCPDPMEYTEKVLQLRNAMPKLPTTPGSAAAYITDNWLPPGDHTWMATPGREFTEAMAVAAAVNMYAPNAYIDPRLRAWVASQGFVAP